MQDITCGGLGGDEYLRPGGVGVHVCGGCEVLREDLCPVPIVC